MTTVRARYHPATVQLPDEPHPRRRVYVILAEGGPESGLHVWSAPDYVADVHLAVDWETTTVPAGRGARNGVTVHLADGDIAVITAQAGCKCGALGRWAGPAWSNQVGVRA